MPTSLSALVPNADDLIALEVEEAAGVLLTHLNSYGNDSSTSAVQHGRISQHNFFNHFDPYPECPDRKTEVIRVLLEAWSWLQSENFLVLDADTTSRWFFLSRRARRLKSQEDFAKYRNASLLPKKQLHPLIATRVYPAFLRGEYDTSVFQAFREVEVAVRHAGNFPADLVGVDLMRKAFRPVNPKNSTVTVGPLVDTTVPVAEQEGMMHLFGGAIAVYKNPQSHRNVPTEAIGAAEVIVFASHLLRIVDQVSPPPEAH